MEKYMVIIHQPYLYKIKHKYTGKVYIGIQIGRNANPKNILTSYFTSSKKVRNLLKEDNDSFFVEKIITADIEYIVKLEFRYLNFFYKSLGKQKFIEKFFNRNLSPGIVLDEEAIKKANSLEKKQKCSVAAKKLLENGEHNFIKHKYVMPEYKRKELSERMKGKQLGTFERDEEYRKKQSISSLGNTNVRGTKWWTDGVKYKRSKNAPGEDWVLGAPKQTEQTKNKRSKSLKNRKFSLQHRKKLSDIAKNRNKNNSEKNNG